MLLRRRCLTATIKPATWSRAQRGTIYDLSQSTGIGSRLKHYGRAFHSRSRIREKDRTGAVLEDFKKTLSFPTATCSLQDLARKGADLADEQVVLYGYLGTRRDASKSLTFAELHDAGLKYTIQLVSTPVKGVDGSDSPHQKLRALETHTPVAIDGTVISRKAPKASDASEGSRNIITSVEIKVENLIPLNAFPKDIIMLQDTVFPPEQRHLQLRNDQGLRDTLDFRSKAARLVRDELCGKQDFIEIETPLLFKSTPEGAREFLVPTREPGLAYALPQSPQQYKQILMASGIPRYMQIAKCFRDEDLRADRQPEFTQIDMEMAFASGEDVMGTIETVIRRLWADCLAIDDLPEDFSRMTYQEAMSKYGSDKPDLRFGAELRRIEYMLPVDLIHKIGPLSDPAVEVMKFSGFNEPQATRKFVSAFMDSPEAQPFVQNPDGQPGIFVYDVRAPLQGLQVFGFEAAEQLEEMLDLDNGGLVVIQARKNVPFAGGSTPIGKLRLAMQKFAEKEEYLPRRTGFNFTWITDFPLFSPFDDAEPGQGGSAGISSTHHPFTAPKTPEDVDLLLTDPLAVKADHYDLVVNGVELGGGSRRIHNAQMQELIMREVLKMSDERMKDFAHLLEVLRAGCPPHAGIALGFDRLIAVMLGKESVRDVIAFPKSGKGEDLLVKSPTKMTEEQMKTPTQPAARNSGLNTPEKIGIGIAVPVGLILLAVLAFFIYRSEKQGRYLKELRLRDKPHDDIQEQHESLRHEPELDDTELRELDGTTKRVPIAELHAKNHAHELMVQSPRHELNGDRFRDR